MHLSFAGCAMKIIYTRKGEEILVDDEDYERLNERTWYVNPDGYAARKAKHPNPAKRWYIQLMHRAVMGLELYDPRMVDHIHHNKLDNRKSELRLCTNKENVRNSRRPRTNSSGYKGVVYHAASGGMWAARITVDNKSKYLGIYRTPEEAYKVYCEAAKKYHGEFANLGDKSTSDATLLAAKASQELAVIAPLVKAALGE